MGRILNKEAWLDALRSGEYKQCRGALKKTKGNKESFCCLGVLTDIVTKHNPHLGEFSDHGDCYFDLKMGFRSLKNLGLPNKIRNHVELDESFWSAGQIEIDNGDIVLATKNDKGASIADIIEKHIEGI